jgi:hypothetical protein
MHDVHMICSSSEEKIASREIIKSRKKNHTGSMRTSYKDYTTFASCGGNRICMLGRKRAVGKINEVIIEVYISIII